MTWFKVFKDKILVQQSESYNLLVFNSEYQTEKTFKGYHGTCPKKEYLRSCRFSSDSKVNIWMAGDGSMHLLNPRDLSKTEIKNFFGTKDQCLPICAVANKDGSKALGLSAIGEAMKFCFWIKGKKAKLTGASEKLSDCKFQAKI